MVSHSNYFNRGTFHPENQIERKTWEHDASGGSEKSWPGVRRLGRQPHHMTQFLNERARGQTAPVVVPLKSFEDFSFGFAVKDDLPVHSVRRRSSARTVSHGTVLAVPESSSATRRSISTRHASSTSGSISDSRLSINKPARVARSCSERFEAFAKSSVT